MVGAGWLMGAAGDGEVRGRRFVLEDERGRVTAELGEVKGYPLLRCFDKGGRMRVQVGLIPTVNGDGKAYLRRYAEDGKPIDEQTGLPATRFLP